MTTNPQSPHRRPAPLASIVIRGLLALLVYGPLPWTWGAEADRDFTCFVFSDIHLGTEKPNAKPPVTSEQARKRVQSNLDQMHGLPGQPFPQQGPLADLKLGNIASPRGLFILGDLTDGHQQSDKRLEQWKTFAELFPAAGVPFGNLNIPVFASLGNHDGEASGPQGQGLIRHHRALQAAGQLAALSENGLHYALNWDGVHIICVNLCPADTVDEQTPFRYGKPGKESWNDPQGAFTFLSDYLKNHVGNSAQPVIILQHYGFDGFSLNDWNWWTPKQRRAMYDLLNDYNVVAIVHGHNHHAEHYRWPDPRQHAADIKAMFPDAPPPTLRQYDVISCGEVCWVFRIKGRQLIAAHYRSPAWSTNNSEYMVKSMAPVTAEHATSPAMPPAPGTESGTFRPKETP